MKTLLDLMSNRSLPNWANAVVSAGVVVLSLSYVWVQVQPILLPGDDYYRQYQIHAGEMAEVHAFTSDDGLVIAVHHYRSDGALLVLAPGRQPKWLPLVDFDLVTPQFSSLNQGVTPPWSVILEASQGSQCVDCFRGVHPGQFRSWHGDKQTGRDGQLWVEVFRQFGDGDVHVQMQRISDGYWNMDLTGAPIVCWVSCPAARGRHY